MPTRRLLLALTTLVALLPLLAAPARVLAQDRNTPPPAEWAHRTLTAGTDAAKTSKKPVLVLTIWAPTICGACDHWRKTVQADDSVKAALGRFETVEWRYDGLRGSVIKWTKDHGNTNDDPSDLLWVLDAAGNVIGSATPADRQSPAAFTAWLDRMYDEFTKNGGRPAAGAGAAAGATTSVDFADGTLTTADGATKPVLQDLATAKSAGKLLFVYVYVPADQKSDFRFASAVQKGEKLESGILADPELAAVLKASCQCIKLNGADEKVMALVAEQFKVSRPPALLLINPGSDKPKVEVFARSTTRVADIRKAIEKMTGSDKR
ncbi:MAG: hypothetical protein AB7K09_17775 [Planctomycetota bacterium]